MKRLLIQISICLFTNSISLAQIEEYKLLSNDGNADDNFGYSVAISGDYVIVGAPGDYDKGENSGSAYIFHREGSNWIKEQKLFASDTNSTDYGFGCSVSIYGDLVIVGSEGHAHKFKRKNK